MFELEQVETGIGDKVTSMVNFGAVKQPDRSPATQAAMNHRRCPRLAEHAEIRRGIDFRAGSRVRAAHCHRFAVRMAECDQFRVSTCCASMPPVITRSAQSRSASVSSSVLRLTSLTSHAWQGGGERDQTKRRGG